MEAINDEDIEQTRFQEFMERVRDFCRRLRVTDWKHYFSGNGPGEVTWKKWTGWREMPNSFDWCGQWIIQVKGGIRSAAGNLYYRNLVEQEDVDMSPSRIERIKARVAAQETILDLYAAPDCSCRLGFHWKCPHHGTWEN